MKNKQGQLYTKRLHKGPTHVEDQTVVQSLLFAFLTRLHVPNSTLSFVFKQKLSQCSLNMVKMEYECSNNLQSLQIDFRNLSYNLNHNRKF